MPPELVALNVDETTAIGLRLMKCLLALRRRRRQEVLVALAEWLVKEEQKSPASY